MPNKVWKGTTDTDFDVAGNWSPSGIPANNDVLIFSDEAVKDLALNLTQAAKKFDVIVNRNFPFAIAASGTPLKPDDFGTIIFEQGVGSKGSFFEAASGGQIDQIIVDAQAQIDNIANFGGTIVRCAVRDGSVQILTGATLNGALTINADASKKTKVLMPAGVTLTGSEVTVNGGVLDVSSNLVNARVLRGAIQLNGSAGVTGRIEVHEGGDLQWLSDNSTIALAEVFGGKFRTLKDRAGRTLTNGNSYGTGQMDFSVGGLTIAFTNPPRAYGVNPIKWPKGAKITAVP